AFLFSPVAVCLQLLASPSLTPPVMSGLGSFHDHVSRQHSITTLSLISVHSALGKRHMASPSPTPHTPHTPHTHTAHKNNSHKTHHIPTHAHVHIQKETHMRACSQQRHTKAHTHA